MTADLPPGAGDVSRETRERFEIYAAHLTRWNRKINLVSPATIGDIWTRHILDSIQLAGLTRGTAKNWVDLGSGAGLPGLLVAVIKCESDPAFSMTLVDSDSRKCAFMAEAARAMGVSVKIETRRLEPDTKAPQRYEIVSARALAPLDKLLGYAAPLASRETVCLFPKGRNRAAELEMAGRTWNMSVEEIASLSDSEGAILRISEISPKKAAYDHR